MPIGDFPPWQLILQNFPMEPFCVLPRLALIEGVKACLATSSKLDPGAIFQLTGGDVIVTKKNADTDFYDKTGTASMRADLDCRFKVPLTQFLDALKSADVDPEFVLAVDGSACLVRTEEYRAFAQLMQLDMSEPQREGPEA